MLGSLFAIAALVCLASGTSPSGPGYPPGYGGRGFFSRRNLYAELAEAKSRVRNLKGNDLIINSRLSDIQIKVTLVSQFRDMFKTQILPNIKLSMEQQDKKINKIAEELKEQADLVDDVEELSTRVNNLLDDLREFRKTRIEILSDVAALENTRIDQDVQISRLIEQIRLQDVRLEEAVEEQVNQTIVINALTRTEKGLRNVINREKSESTTVELTKEESSVVVNFSNEYDEVPSLVWTVVGLHATDTEEYYDLESIKAKVVPSDLTKKSVKISLVDESAGFRFDSVKVRVTAFVVDNRKLNY